MIMIPFTSPTHFDYYEKHSLYSFFIQKCMICFCFDFSSFYKMYLLFDIVFLAPLGAQELLRYLSSL